MIEFYTANSSNGQRVAVMLEECGLPYTLHKVDLMGGEQHRPEFLRINPAAAIPAIVDQDGPGGRPLTLAQSGAIMVYLAEKTGRFLPADPVRRAHAFQWLMQSLSDVSATGSVLFLLGNFAPEKSDANQRWFGERFVKFLRDADRCLATREYLADELSIADFSLYPVANSRRALVDAAGDLPHLVRWMAALGGRPGVARGVAAAA
ncbi:MAG: glutathione S-transferase family protein [Burkholderiales bacterium]